MFFHRYILAIFIMMSLGFKSQAHAETIDVESVIDLMNQNLEMEPISKNHVSLQMDASLSTPYKLIYTVSEKGLEVTLAIKPEALNSPIMVREALARLRMAMHEEIMNSMPQALASDQAEVYKITEKKEDLCFKLNVLFKNYEVPLVKTKDRSFTSPLVVADLQANARLGSVIAQSELAILELEFEKNFRALTSEKSDQEIDEKIKTLRQVAQKEQLRREKIYRDPARTAARDKARLNTKLDELLKNNDRKGVATLFEKMLPWELMEPVQITAWKNWIDSIRHPSKDTVTLYRGLDRYDRLIQNPGNNQAGLFAAMVNRNQGSYSDRLRSVAKLYLLNRNKDLMNGLGQHFYLHAQETKASPYISFSPDIQVASMFAEKGLMAVQVDRRRAVTNLYSQLKAEIEVLVPLIIFPDEIRGIFSKDETKTYEEFVPKAIGIKAPKTFKELIDNGKFYSDFYKYVTGLEVQTSQTKSCSQVFTK